MENQTMVGNNAAHSGTIKLHGSNPQSSYEMPSIASLKDLLVDELKDLYSAEQQLVKALPKMSKASSHENLKDSFNSHLEETHGHVQRLEEAFSWLGVPAKAKTCKAMQGLSGGGGEETRLNSMQLETLRDACLIGGGTACRALRDFRVRHRPLLR